MSIFHRQGCPFSNFFNYHTFDMHSDSLFLIAIISSQVINFMFMFLTYKYYLTFGIDKIANI